MNKFLTTLATVHEDAWQKFLTNQLLHLIRSASALKKEAI
jgi:hypothetical protein